MKKLTICLVLIPFLNISHIKAQEPIKVVTKKTTVKTYSGKIGKQQVKAALFFTDNRVNGEYIVNRSETTWHLTGEIYSDSLNLTAEVEVADTNNSHIDFTNAYAGKLKLRFSNADKLSGYMYDEKGKNRRKILLNKTSETVYENATAVGVHHNQNPVFNIDTLSIEDFDQLHFLSMKNYAAISILDSIYQSPAIQYLTENKITDLDQIPGIKSESDVFFDEWNEELDSEEFYSYQLPFSATVSHNVAFADNHIISVIWSAYEFTGGAHANGGRRGENYVTATGEKFELAQIFIDGYKNFLDSIAEFYFCQKTLISPGDTESIYHYFTAGYFTSENFYCSLIGIHILYNGYEMGGWYNPVDEFTIPYSALKKIIKAEGPLGWVLEKGSGF